MKVVCVKLLFWISTAVAGACSRIALAQLEVGKHAANRCGTASHFEVFIFIFFQLQSN
jgi:hypothetical protein